MKAVQYIKILFLILSVIALSFIIPISTAVYLGDFYLVQAFVVPLIIVLVISTVLIIVSRRVPVHLSTRGGIVLVALAWTFAGVLGALPFVISGTIPNFIDAFFEAVSGFTTTGATILTNIDDFPLAMHVWRTQMHWLGGMGIVALTVALFPLLGVGGFHLIKSETTGPDKGKVTAKITHTAKALWFIYIGLTVLEIMLLMAAGMNFIDAICHTFATVGTGGFSTQGASIGAYNSTAIDVIITVFMLLAGVNFSLYFKLCTGNVREVFRNSEFKAYIKIVFVASAIVVISIFPLYGLKDALRHGFFQVASIMTTTGFATVDFDQWPALAKMTLFTVMFIGGCSGSTAGSIKVIRWVVLRRQARNEIKRLLHPHGVFTIHLNNRPGRKDVVYSIAGFLFIYFFLLLMTAFVAVLGGADLLSSISTSLVLVGNIGPGFAMVGPTQNFAFFTQWTKVFFSFAMLAGRLELYTMIIIFTSSFWRR